MHNMLKALLAGAFILLITLLLLTTCRHNRGEARDADDVGQDGDIKVTMLWDFPGDVDLHVMQPNGTEISFMYTDDSDNGGGVLDVDDRAGGRGAAENIYWRNPMHGNYTVQVVLYRADEGAPSGGPVQVVVKVDGRATTYNLNISSESEVVNVCNFSYPASTR